MKTFIIVLLFGLFAIVGFMFLVNATDVMTVEANIFAPAAPIIRVEVPDYVFVGNVSKGVETDKVRVDINNTGNVAIVVTPDLIDQNDQIFSNLYFARRTTDSYKRIGNWGLNISAPPEGSKEGEYFYMKLDLRTFNGNITQDMLGRKADVKFIATAQ